MTTIVTGTSPQMNIPDNRPSPVTITNDMSHDSSDVLSLLQVIEQLYVVSRHVINSQSAQAILLSMTIELQTLQVKLQAMHRRWCIHLPFKEASTIDFAAWSNKAKQMAESINDGDQRYCLDTCHDIPSCHCLVDLYEQATCWQSGAGNTGHPEVETDAKKLLNQRSIIQEALKVQRTQCVDAITQMVTMQLCDRHTLNLTLPSDAETMRAVCSTLFTELSELLQQMHDQLVKFFSAKDYERLADRILYEAEYEGQKARREAREAVVNWRNGAPVKNLNNERQTQIEQVKEEIRKTKHGIKLEQFVDLDDDFPKQRSEFGRFLFHRRREITRSELRRLILLIYSVYYYQQDARQPVGQGNDDTSCDTSTPSYPPLPADFLQTLRDTPAAVKLFYEILYKIEPYINGGRPANSTPELDIKYKAWTWYHLMAAFVNLGILPKNPAKASFARFINTVFPHRSEDSVNRSLYRNPNVNSPGIVADVAKEFNPVCDLWK